ncbi:MAG: ABC transporter ATP-binding protein [Planctomycetota bacterium]
MIQFKDVVKRLDGRNVLDGLNLHVQTGETYVIIGGSGTGKSVTLKHMVGLMQPDSGQVLIDDIDIGHADTRQLRRIRRKFGFVFQDAALINWLDVGQNIALPLKEHTKLSNDEVDETVREKLALVNLTGIERKLPSQLSGGMRKRVGLARAIVMNPEIILYDEPTAGLDPVMTSAISHLIADLQHRLHTTSVVVTHDMESAYVIADRIGMLHKGKMIWEGTVDDIRTADNPRVRAFVEGRYDPNLDED